MELICSSVVLDTLGSEFDDYTYLPAHGTRGGILLAWKSRAVTITDPLFTTNALTAKVTTATGAPWWLTVVYGPQEDAAKIMFLQELREIRADCPGPWMLCGDFNLIYRAEDKSNGGLNRRMMGRFRRVINDLVLKEIYLNGRRFTWSNEQTPPTLVHLDRVLCTSDWEDAHGECHLRCLASVVSDHCPLLLDCSPMPAAHKRFHFEDYWLRLDGFHDTVAAAWGSVHDPDPFRRLVLRLQATARRLTSWGARSTGNIRDKLAISRELISRFDKAQEDRVLSPPEDWLRKQIKIAYLGLASMERTIARQRARIANLQDGDANTNFFHRQCSFRRQKNRVLGLTADGRVLTEHEEMAQAAFTHFDGLLGTAVDRDCTLDLSQLIEPSDLACLDVPFSPEEIWDAIKRLPARKAPGPDGFTAEFLRACWGIIRQDLLDAFQLLFELRGRGFSKLNQALLTLLPKRADAHQLGDYRPICLIHLVAKIFAKVLSLRLAPKLDNLVSRNQNAFIAGRSLHDNFVLVRQSLKLLHQLGAPRIMLKLDLTRAFDSISWPFLFEVLRQYGFGDRFREWLAILLTTASTRVLLNGEPGPPIWHRRGLRQGDPISPQLFVLAVDTLGRLMRRALQDGILQQLHPRRAIPAISLYADDVMLFCHATPGDVAAVKGILALFGMASGLQVNYAKSSATVLHGDATAAGLVEQLGCPAVDLPVTYLGIPLTTRRPSATQLQPLVDSVAGRLPAWKAWLMNKTGRLAMVTSVLSAIPVHQMLALAPPKKTLRQLEKIQRGFLWAGRAAANGGHCHVNWRRVCRPIEYGGLGVRDLERAGLALRLRWLWFARTDNERAWQGLDLQFTTEERALFYASTTMAIGDGSTALFWEDRWLHGQSVREFAPLLYQCIPKRRRKSRTVAEGIAGNTWARDIHGVLGLHEIGQYLRLWQAVQHTVLSSEPDRLYWKWSANGIYSAQSCYLATFQGSTTCYSWKLTWKSWAPPRVKFFHWLANQDRCWTADRLARRGLQHHPRCLLCDQTPETIQHLLLACPFARQTWHAILTWLGIPAPTPEHEANMMDWWLRAKDTTPPTQRKALQSIALLVPWMIWKHINACVFDHATPSINDLVGRIKDEARCWAKAGAQGLRVVLPPSWDVH